MNERYDFCLHAPNSSTKIKKKNKNSGRRRIADQKKIIIII